MAAAVWSERSRVILPVAALALCLAAIAAGPLSGAAQAAPGGDRGAQVVRDEGKVVRVEVPADRRAGERAGANARTETARASVARPVDVAGSTMITFGIVDPILMTYDVGLRHLDFSGLSQLVWPEGYTGHVNVSQGDQTLADQAIAGDTMVLYPLPGYVAFPAAPTELTLTIYAKSRLGGIVMYRSWPFELVQL